MLDFQKTLDRLLIVDEAKNPELPWGEEVTVEGYSIHGPRATVEEKNRLQRELLHLLFQKILEASPISEADLKPGVDAMSRSTFILVLNQWPKAQESVSPETLTWSVTWSAKGFFIAGTEVFCR
jgi:hypothetical protein